LPQVLWDPSSHLYYAYFDEWRWVLGFPKQRHVSAGWRAQLQQVLWDDSSHLYYAYFLGLRRARGSIRIGGRMLGVPEQGLMPAGWRAGLQQVLWGDSSHLHLPRRATGSIFTGGHRWRMLGVPKHWGVSTRWSPRLQPMRRRDPTNLTWYPGWRGNLGSRLWTGDDGGDDGRRLWKGADGKGQRADPGVWFRAIWLVMIAQRSLRPTSLGRCGSCLEVCVRWCIVASSIAESG